MTTGARLQLLRLLEPAVRPLAAPSPTGPAPRSESFSALLERAARGELATGRAVTVAVAAALPAPLSPEQLARIGAAADRAEAAGATAALVLVDGRGVLLDVGQRVVTAELASGALSSARVELAVAAATKEAVPRPALLPPGAGPPPLAPPAPPAPRGAAA